MSETLNIDAVHEASQQGEALPADGFRGLVEQYGIQGNTPQERVSAFKKLPPEQVAVFLTDLNRQLLGSEETQIADYTMKIGQKETIQPEDRYTLFTGLIRKISEADDTVDPGRIGDTLGLGIVLLHPFKDGNGRTSRMMSLLFREEYDDQKEFHDAYSALGESRDIARARGGFIINGLIPYLPDGMSQTDPADVDKYFDTLLTSNDTQLYTGPAGQAPLHR